MVICIRDLPKESIRAACIRISNIYGIPYSTIESRIGRAIVIDADFICLAKFNAPDNPDIKTIATTAGLTREGVRYRMKKGLLITGQKPAEKSGWSARKESALSIGISRKLFNKRCAKGWDIDKAATTPKLNNISSR